MRILLGNSLVRRFTRAGKVCQAVDEIGVDSVTVHRRVSLD